MTKQTSDLYNLDKAHNLKHLGFPTKVHALVECDVCGQNHKSFILSKLVEHHSGRVIAQALLDRFPLCAEGSALFPSNRSIDTYKTKYMQKDTDLRGVPVIDTAIQEVQSKWHGIAETEHPHVKDMINLRNYFRSHPEVIQEYSNLKFDLVKKYPDDYGLYRKYKDEWMEKLKQEIRLDKYVK